MPPFLFRSFSAAFLGVLVLSSPAAAQESAAKTAWQELRAFARERGILIASQGVTDYGSSLVAQNVRIFSPDEPEAVVITMAEMRIEPRGTALALIPSAEFLVTVHPDSRSEYVFAVSHTGEIIADVSDDRIALDLPFDHLAVTTLLAASRGAAVDQSLNLSFAGLAVQAEVLRAGDAELSISADTMHYAFVLSEPNSRAPNRQAGEAEITGLAFEFTGHELDMMSSEPGMMPAAFAAGFNAHFSLSAQSSRGTSEQNIDGNDIAITSSSGASEFTVEVANGGISATTLAEAGRISGGMAPFVGEVSFGAVGMAVGMPLIATPEEQTIYYRFNFDDIVASSETLALVGAQEFGGEPITLALDISAQGRLTQDFGVEFVEADAPPFDVTSISLNQLRTRVGATELSGSGSFAFLGGLLNSLGRDFPDGTGDFVFELIGGDALLTRLSAIGIVPADQQFFARMMMNGLGTPIGDDHLRSEVAMRPGGQITVNGAPLPF